MEITFIDGSKNGQETIAQAAGVCYGNPDKDVSRIKRLKQHKHLATLRFAHAVIRVENISIACQNQMVRSKHLDFLVESKRYVTALSTIFIKPDNYIGEMQEHFNKSIELYDKMVSAGIPKEDARSVLPMNTSTSMYIAGNLQAWMDMLKLRVSKHAQLEIRRVAFNIWKVLIENYPLVFSDLEFEGMNFSSWQDVLEKTTTQNYYELKEINE